MSPDDISATSVVDTRVQWRCSAQKKRWLARSTFTTVIRSDCRRSVRLAARAAELASDSTATLIVSVRVIIAGLLVVTLGASTANPRGKGDAERKHAPIDDFACAGRARCRRDRAR